MKTQDKITASILAAASISVPHQLSADCMIPRQAGAYWGLFCSDQNGMGYAACMDTQCYYQDEYDQCDWDNPGYSDCYNQLKKVGTNYTCKFFLYTGNCDIDTSSNRMEMVASGMTNTCC